MNPERVDFIHFLSFLRRRKWQILLPAAILLALTVVLIKLLPPTYRSSATILIEEQEIPTELVGSTISSYADQRIQVIARQVMTRANLKQIIEKFDLQSKRRNGVVSESIVQGVRRNIDLEMLSAEVTDRRSGNKTTATIAFVLSYFGESAQQAQQVTTELVSLFLNENLKNRRQHAADTERLLHQEAERLEAQLAAIELNLARFKQRNAEQLPEQAQVNMQLRERAEVEILEADRQISSLVQRKADLQAQLVQVKPYAPAMSATGERVLDAAERLRLARAQYESLLGIYSADHPDVQRLKQEIDGLHRQLNLDQGRVSRQREADNLRAQLGALRERYSDEHPDVINVRTQLDALESNLQAEPAGLPAWERGTRNADNPAFLTLRAQLSATQAEIDSVRARQNQLRAKLVQYERRLRDTPQAEREYLEITRERENATQRYQEIKAKLMDARVAQEIERHSEAERFAVIEPPDLPEKPVRPNRLALALLGAMLSLGAGLAYGGIREALDRTIHNVEQLASALPIPVLAAIPTMPGAMGTMLHGARRALTGRLTSEVQGGSTENA